jgi:hypothetical protein
MGAALRGPYARAAIPCPIAKRRNHAERLRNAVYALPSHTKAAMLRGIRANRVIVGAYVDKRGGVCPMLAAHRNGGRTNFGTFARAWDAFTDAKERKPRRASPREVRTLEGYLEIALMREGAAPAGGQPERPLSQEVRDVKATRRRLAEAEARETAANTLGDVLARTYAEAEERRAETRVLEVLAGEDDLDSADGWSAALERADSGPR